VFCANSAFYAAPCLASGPHREDIRRKHGEGKSIKEISTALGVNFATVYRVLRRAGRVKKKRS
jgi:IS30 family transposase